MKSDEAETSPAEGSGEGSSAAQKSGSALAGSISVRSVALTGLFVLATLAAMHVARPILVPMVLAVLLAMMLSPIVRGMRRRLRIPPGIGAAALLVVATAIVGTIGWSLSGPAAEMLNELPVQIDRLESKVRGLTEGVDELRDASERMQEMARNTDDETVPVRVEEPKLAEFVFGQTWFVVTTTALTLGLLYFLLAADDLFLQKLVKAAPTMGEKKTALRIVEEIRDDLRWYLLEITLINIGLGIAVGLAMWALGMPYPALWGAMATLFNFIPFAGALVGVGVVTLAAAATFDGVGLILLVPLVYYSLTAIEGSIVTPTILGQKLVLNPVVIFIALIFWGWMWGFVGIFLAVPIMSSVKIVCDRIEPLKIVGAFLGR